MRSAACLQPVAVTAGAGGFKHRPRSGSAGSETLEKALKLIPSCNLVFSVLFLIVELHCTAL